MKVEKLDGQRWQSGTALERIKHLRDKRLRTLCCLLDGREKSHFGDTW